MRQGAFLNISFEPQLITLTQQTWSVYRYKQGAIFSLNVLNDLEDWD